MRYGAFLGQTQPTLQTNICYNLNAQVPAPNGGDLANCPAQGLIKKPGATLSVRHNCRRWRLGPLSQNVGYGADRFAGRDDHQRDA